MGGRREESGERGVTAFPSRQIPATGLSTDSTTSLPNTRDAPVVVGCRHDRAHASSVYQLNLNAGTKINH
jgi:hypothetical protein